MSMPASDVPRIGRRSVLASGDVLSGGLCLMLSSVIMVYPALAMRGPPLHALASQSQRHLLLASQCTASANDAQQLSSLVSNVPAGKSELVCLAPHSNSCAPSLLLFVTGSQQTCR
jgi:hypothetical protein